MIHLRKDHDDIQSESIPENEPVLLIRASDPCGPEAVYWMASCVLEHPEFSEELRSRMLAWAQLMRSWADTHGVEGTCDIDDEQVRDLTDEDLLEALGMELATDPDTGASHIVAVGGAQPTPQIDPDVSAVLDSDQIEALRAAGFSVSKA